MLWENQSSVNNIKMKRKKIYSRQKIWYGFVGSHCEARRVCRTQPRI